MANALMTFFKPLLVDNRLPYAQKSWGRRRAISS